MFFVSPIYICCICIRILLYSCFAAHVVPGLFLICIPFVGAEANTCVAFISLSLGFNGVSALTNVKNAQDLSPNYAATIFAIINCIGTSNGFIVPHIVTYFTSENV